MSDFGEMLLLPESDLAHGGRFDYEAAAWLKWVFNQAATTLGNQTALRASHAEKGSKDFKGRFSRVFAENAKTAAADSRDLASALRYVADCVTKMVDAGQVEDARRRRNNEWVRKHNARSLLDRAEDFITHSEEPRPTDPEPAKGPTFPEWTPTARSRQTPAPGSGGGQGGGVSSARPANLRSFAKGVSQLDQALDGQVRSLNVALHGFNENCQWAHLQAGSVIKAYRTYLNNNAADTQWANTLAAAFEKAGGSGGLAILPDAALQAALKAAGVAPSRTPLEIDPPKAYGAQPTSGYSDDPVNAGTGNFTEPECDLAFTGQAAGLSITRTYNSLNAEAGVFGHGWSSALDQVLTITDDSARWQAADGRVITFPRDGRGWGRADGDSYWLSAEAADEAGFAGISGTHGGQELLVVRDNAGSWWAFTPAGVWQGSGCGRGRTVRVARDQDGRVAALCHERGRRVGVDYADGVVASITADDERRVDYGYDDGRLAWARSADGTRRYVWDDAGRITQVISPARVVEVANSYDDRGRVARQTSPFGRTSRYSYLPGGVTVVADEDGGRPDTWIHDGRGRLIGAVDSHGYRQSMSWDRWGNLLLCTGRDGATTVRVYDERGRVTRSAIPDGADVSYTWDEQDRLTGITRAGGAAVAMSYDDPIGRDPSQITDPLGGITRLRWCDGLLTGVVDPTGVTADIDYDEAGNLTEVRDAAGNRTRFQWDRAGRLLAVTTPAGATTRLEWDQAGRPVARRDADGAVWRFEYDGTGRQTAVTDPAGARTVSEYASNGELSRVIDPLGRATDQDFDDLGNLAALTLPDGARWLFDHDSLSRLASLTDPDGGQWTREYDPVGQLRAATDPSGVRTTTSTDNSAGTTTLRDAFSATTVSSDRFGRPVRVEHPDGSAELASYDAVGNVTELVDADGGLTSIERDLAGKITAITSPRGALTRFCYDRCGRPQKMIDPNGGLTELEYDADQRVIGRNLPGGEREEFSYDPVGRLTQLRTPAGIYRWRYDACGRPVWSRDPIHGTRRFSYNLAGELVEAVNGVGGRTRFDYDQRGRLTKVVDPAGGVTRYGYTGLDEPASTTDPLGRVAETRYDPAGRLTWLNGPDGHVTDWSFDAAGRLSAMAIDGQTMAAWHVDPESRTVTITDHTRPDGVPVTHRLVYDPTGRLMSQARECGSDTGSQAWEWDGDGNRVGFTDASGAQTRYRYDAAGQLVGVERPGLSGVSYRYDRAGLLAFVGAGQADQSWARRDGAEVAHTLEQAGRTASTRVERDAEGRIAVVVRDGSTTRYSYDDAGQLSAAVTEAGESTQERRWSYDAAGRLIQESGPQGRIEYCYDAAGQLVSESGPEGTSRYSYDGAGRRVRSEAADGTVTEFSWSPVGALSGITVRRSGAGVETHRLWSDALGQLAEVDGAALWWDTASGLPTLTGAGGLPVAYAPGGLTGVGGDWGTAGWRSDRATEPADPWGVGFPGGVGGAGGGSLPAGVSLTGSGSLSVAGYEVLGARLYDSVTRAFLSPDPLDPVVGAGWSGNPYAYAGNNPVGLLDPSGLRPMTDEDLKKFDANSRSSFGALGRWVGNNWEYLAAGAGIAAGIALACTGVGGPAGIAPMAASGALVSGGTSLAGQKFEHDKKGGAIDWRGVGIDTLIGGAAGAAGGWASSGLTKLNQAAKIRSLTASSTRGGDLLRPLLTHTGRSAIPAGASGATNNLLSYQAKSTQHTAGGYIQAIGIGFGTSALADVGASETSAVVRMHQNVPLDYVPPSGAPRAMAPSVERRTDIFSIGIDHTFSGVQAGANELLRPPNEDDSRSGRRPGSAFIWGLASGIGGSTEPSRFEMGNG